MPELPEVEVTRRSLAPALEGSQIRAVELGKPLRWPLGIQPSRLKGCVFGPLVRRGKYLWMPLIRHLGMAPESAGPAGGLLVHLGMSGSLGFCPSAAGLPAAGPHDHVRILTDRGALTLTDPRRFGADLRAEHAGSWQAIDAYGDSPDLADADLGARWLDLAAEAVSEAFIGFQRASGGPIGD